MIVDKHQTAVFGEILQQGQKRRPLLVVELVEVAVRHDNERALRHHRHRFDRVGQILHAQSPAGESVEVELLKSLGNELLFQLAQVVFAQIALLAVEDIYLPDCFLFQIGLELLVTAVRSFFLCHSDSSIHGNVYVSL